MSDDGTVGSTVPVLHKIAIERVARHDIHNNNTAVKVIRATLLLLIQSLVKTTSARSDNRDTAPSHPKSCKDVCNAANAYG